MFNNKKKLPQILNDESSRLRFSNAQVTKRWSFPMRLVHRVRAILPGNRKKKSLTQILATSQKLSLLSRDKQLEEISSEEEKRRRKATEKTLNQNMALSLASLGLATTGFLYWPLGLLSVPGCIYLCLPLYQKSYRSLKQGQIGVETLTTMVISGSLISGYFFIANFAGVVFQIAFRLLSKVMDDSKKSLVDVFRQQPNFAWLLVDGVEVRVPFESLTIGQIVVVNAGEIIPIDGTITAGVASVDQHSLTGESQPVEKGSGDTIFASTVVLSGRIEIAVEKAGDETTVSKIGHILNNTVEFKATAQLRAETLADKTVVPTLIVGGLSVSILGPMGALAVLNAHFRDKMSIVAPLSIMNFLNLASQHGILIKDGRTLDLLNKIDTIVFDKTGTLTEEQPQLRSIHVWADYDENEILRYAAAAEQKQSHPIARAIIKAAQEQQLNIPPINEAEYKVGYGLTVTLNDKLVCVGSRRFMEMIGSTIPSIAAPVQKDSHANGHSLVMIAINQVVIGAIELLPTIRPEAKAIISQLRQRHKIKSMYIISGDHERPTQKLAQELGIDHYFAETLPQDKAALIEQLQSEGKFICYVGDGINDSIALKKSHVSISLRGASSVATDTAQIILMDGTLKPLSRIFDFAQSFHTNINVGFALVLLPTVIGIGGAFFLHFGLMHTILLNLASLTAGVSNSMLPLLKHKSKS